ncbi:MAG: hypothetical protein WC942_12275 [Clostridia bacterium]|jgi:hypothetical protein
MEEEIVQDLDDSGCECGMVITTKEKIENVTDCGQLNIITE